MSPLDPDGFVVTIRGGGGGGGGGSGGSSSSGVGGGSGGGSSSGGESGGCDGEPAHEEEAEVDLSELMEVEAKEPEEKAGLGELMDSFSDVLE